MRLDSGTIDHMSPLVRPTGLVEEVLATGDTALDSASLLL
jgi:hypothetical protein